MRIMAVIFSGVGARDTCVSKNRQTLYHLKHQIQHFYSYSYVLLDLMVYLLTIVDIVQRQNISKIYV